VPGSDSSPSYEAQSSAGRKPFVACSTMPTWLVNKYQLVCARLAAGIVKSRHQENDKFLKRLTVPVTSRFAYLV
jgi:hypothetical protein